MVRLNHKLKRLDLWGTQGVECGRPLIEHVGFAFLVAGAVAELDGDEATALVEAAGARVPLEGVEAHAGWTSRHRLRKQGAADTAALLAGQDVELGQHLPIERGNAD